MAKFRKKPVVIEATRYEGKGNMYPSVDGKRGQVPTWFWDALENKTAEFTNGADPLIIHTLEGDHTVSPHDWIIRGVKGELYPCKPDIFETTYEAVEEEEDIFEQTAGPSAIAVGVEDNAVVSEKAATGR
jgi:hypothetical protein